MLCLLPGKTWLSSGREKLASTEEDELECETAEKTISTGVASLVGVEWSSKIVWLSTGRAKTSSSRSSDGVTVGLLSVSSLGEAIPQDDGAGSGELVGETTLDGVKRTLDWAKTMLDLAESDWSPLSTCGLGGVGLKKHVETC